jgi:hypothetical protein
MYDIQLFYGYVFSRCVFDTVVRKHLPELDSLVETTSYESAVGSLFSKNVGVRTSYDVLTRRDRCSEVYVYLLSSGFDIQRNTRDAFDMRGSKILDRRRFVLNENDIEDVKKDLRDLNLLGLQTGCGWTLITS